MENQNNEIPLEIMPYKIEEHEILNNTIKHIRKNPSKFLKLTKQKSYFKEDNYEKAILNMLNSGLGRQGRRNLAKKIMMTWDQYLEAENIVVENNIDSLSQSAKKSYLSSRLGLLFKKKITQTEYDIFFTIVTQKVSYDEAEKIVSSK